MSHEPCNCGAEPTVIYGPDIRFNPPCSKPMMWRSQCSANDCNDSPSFTAFTRERALELWDGRMRDTRGVASGSTAPDHIVPDGVWEALQRLIENAETLGPASKEDALLVARWRGRFVAARDARGVRENSNG